MSRGERPRDGGWRWWAAGGVVLVLIALLAAGGSLDSGASVFSRGAAGLMLARGYLEAQGVETRVLSAPLDTPAEATDDEPPGVLVLAFPWQRPVSATELTALEDHLRAGGDLLLAYGGGLELHSEPRVLAQLGLERIETSPPPPLWPTAWWRERRPDRVLVGEDERPPLVIGRPPELAPLPPAGATVLYRDPATDAALIFALRRRQGRVVALPAEALANARLGEPGNADLLATLGRWLAGPWSFDEYHHGLVDQALVVEKPRQVWDLFALHLLLLYGMLVWALARPFGRRWRDPPVASGSAGAFLRGLGRLHHRLGHHRQAGRRLVERLRELDPRAADPDLEPLAEAIDDPKDLLELARRAASPTPQTTRTAP